MSARRRELTGRHVLLIFLAAFALVLAVNVVFITLSLRTFTGEDTPDAYSRGLTYNDVLEERTAQAALGWRAAVTVEAGDTATLVRVDLTDAAGAPISGAEVTVLFRRPTHEGEDTEAACTEARPGVYTAMVELPGAGVWDARGRAVRGAQERLDFEERLWVE